MKSLHLSLLPLLGLIANATSLDRRNEAEIEWDSAAQSRWYQSAYDELNPDTTASSVYTPTNTGSATAVAVDIHPGADAVVSAVTSTTSYSTTSTTHDVGDAVVTEVVTYTLVVEPSSKSLSYDAISPVTFLASDVLTVTGGTARVTMEVLAQIAAVGWMLL